MTQSTKLIAKLGVVSLIGACNGLEDSSPLFSPPVDLPAVEDWAPEVSEVQTPVYVEPEPDAPGYQIADGYGIGYGPIALPNDTHQTWVFTEGFDDGFLTIAKKAMSHIASIVPWQIEQAQHGVPDVLFIADPGPASSACTNGTSGSCWTGTAECTTADQFLSDDPEGHVLCAQWTIHLSPSNVYAFAHHYGLDVAGQILPLIMHEFGHTLGFMHLHSKSAKGVMRPIFTSEDATYGYTPCEIAQLQAFQVIEKPGVQMVTPEECE